MIKIFDMTMRNGVISLLTIICLLADMNVWLIFGNSRTERTCGQLLLQNDSLQSVNITLMQALKTAQRESTSVTTR
jgi:hypothetical protein